jgi:hypothetical protein
MTRLEHKTQHMHGQTWATPQSVRPVAIRIHVVGLHRRFLCVAKRTGSVSLNMGSVTEPILRVTRSELITK